MAAVRESVDMATVADRLQAENVQKSNYERVLMADAEKWESTLKKEILNWGQYEITVSELSNNYIENNFNSIIKDKENEQYTKYLYYVSDPNFKEKTYIYDKDSDMVYKIPSTRISIHKVHSVEELDYLENGGKRGKSKVDYTLISQNAEIRQVGNLKYYEPDLNNLAKEATSLIFYEKVNGNITTAEYPVTADEWLQQGKPNEIEKDGHTYILYDYENKIWANIRIETSHIETNWTWIPRFEYLNSGTETRIAFVDIENNKLNGEEGEFTKQEIFKDNTRKGMWVSKYEPISKQTTDTKSYSYYVPDVTGLDRENTYLEIYDDKAENFVDSIPLSSVTNLTKFAQDNNWYDYYNQRWANIKVVKNGIETWWVWIPRYALNPTQDQFEVIFTDITDNPIDGTTFSNLTIPEVFKGNQKRGIWVSKYEPIQK